MMTRSLVWTAGPGTAVARYLTWLTVFFTGVFGAFYLLGYVNLFTDLPVVDPVHALAVALVVVASLWIWLGKRKRSLAKEEADAVHPLNVLRVQFLPGNRNVLGKGAVPLYAQGLIIPACVGSAATA